MRNRMGGEDIESGPSGGNEAGSDPSYDSEKEKKGSSLRSYYLAITSQIVSMLPESSGGSGSAENDPSACVSGGLTYSNEHSSFRVIGYEIGWMSPLFQYLYCASGVLFFLVLYGILQEHVVMNKFHRSLGWFVTFLQLGGYGIFAAALDSFVGSHKKEGKIPIYMYVILGFLQVFMQGFTNLSMHYLNYPAKTMFKSSRVIMTMLFGVVFMGKQYQWVNYAVGGCIVCGLTLCVVADAETSPEFSLAGLVLIMLALCADAAILNLQEYCLNRYRVTHDELIYYSFTLAAFLAFVMSVVSGEFVEGFHFLGTDGTLQVLLLFVIFTLTGFLGMSCLAALTKRFGALKSAVTSTVRKGFTLILSYLIFPEGKAFTMLHGVGTLVFLGGLFLESTTKLKREPTSNFSNITSEEDEEIGIITGNLNETEALLPIAVAACDSCPGMSSPSSFIHVTDGVVSENGTFPMRTSASSSVRFTGTVTTDSGDSTGGAFVITSPKRMVSNPGSPTKAHSHHSVLNSGVSCS